MSSGKVCDDLTVDLLAKYNIEVVTINAISPFNRVDEALLAKTNALLQEAQAIGAKALVMCPLNEGVEIAPEETLAAINTLAPRFTQHGVQGLVEPLGFPVS